MSRPVRGFIGPGDLALLSPALPTPPQDIRDIIDRAYREAEQYTFGPAHKLVVDGLASFAAIRRLIQGFPRRWRANPRTLDAIAPDETETPRHR